MTRAERNIITVHATDLGLDGRIADLCQDSSQVDQCYMLQQEVATHSEVYRHLLNTAPKEKTREHEAALTHIKSLGKYLFETEQYEALAALDNVHIKPQQPRALSYKAEIKETLEAEITFMNKTYKRETIKYLMEYLLADPDGTIY